MVRALENHRDVSTHISVVSYVKRRSCLSNTMPLHRRNGPDTPLARSRNSLHCLDLRTATFRFAMFLPELLRCEPDFDRLEAPITDTPWILTRLVENEQLWLAGEGHGDAESLLHTK